MNKAITPRIGSNKLKPKYTNKDKLQVLREYYIKGKSIKEISQNHIMSYSNIRYIIHTSPLSREIEAELKARHIQDQEEIMKLSIEQAKKKVDKAGFSQAVLAYGVMHDKRYPKQNTVIDQRKQTIKIEYPNWSKK